MASGAETEAPIVEIAAERERAREAKDLLADVCYLATFSSRGPEARPLSLRGVCEAGIGVTVSRSSPKWAESAALGASLLLHWPTIRRQYRVRGRVAEMTGKELASWWARKAHEARLLEHFYAELRPQSAPIASRADLVEGIEALRRRWPAASDVPIPDLHAGLLLVPDEVETWHGSAEDRLHERTLWKREGEGWTRTTLVP